MDPRVAVRTFLDEWRQPSLPWGERTPADVPTGARMLAAAESTRARVVVAAGEHLRLLAETADDEELRAAHEGLRALLRPLMRDPPAFREDQLVALLASVGGDPPPERWLPAAPVHRAAQEHVARHGCGPELRDALAGARTRLLLGGPTSRKSARRIQEIMTPVASTLDPIAAIEPDPAWGTGARRDLAALERDARLAWTRLLEHAAAPAGRARPTASWRREARALVAAVGEEAFGRQLAAWLPRVRLGMRPDESEWAKIGSAVVPHGPTDRNLNVLRGLIRAAADSADDALLDAIAAFAGRCFARIPNHGPGSTRLGNACLWTLAAAPGARGVPHLVRLRAQVDGPGARGRVEAALEVVAAAAGLPRERLEELAVPTHGLAMDGTRVFDLGEHGRATLAVTGPRSVSVTWAGADGSRRRGPPRAARSAAPAEVERVLRERAEVRSLLVGQSARLEGLLVAPWTWSASEFFDRYLEHPVLAHLARRLVWTVGSSAVCWADGLLRTRVGTPVVVQRDDEVHLWHPVDVDEATRALWADRLDRLGVVQPFAQVHRVVFSVDDDERERLACGRLAGRVVRQHALRQVCRAAGWRAVLLGRWGERDAPVRRFPSHDIEASLELRPVPGADGGRSGFGEVRTGAVRFAREGRPLALGAVPGRVFSEALRDVAGFVRACAPEVEDLGSGARARARALRKALGGHAPARRVRVEGEVVVVRAPDGEHRFDLRTGSPLGQRDAPGADPVAGPAPRRAPEDPSGPAPGGDEVLDRLVAQVLALFGDERDGQLAMPGVRGPRGGTDGR